MVFLILPISTLYEAKGLSDMKKDTAKKFIEAQLKDLDVPRDSEAYRYVYASAIEAAEIMTKRELKAYIEGVLETLPNSHFQ